MESCSYQQMLLASVQKSSRPPSSGLGMERQSSDRTHPVSHSAAWTGHCPDQGKSCYKKKIPLLSVRIISKHQPHFHLSSEADSYLCAGMGDLDVFLGVPARLILLDSGRCSLADLLLDISSTSRTTDNSPVIADTYKHK